MNTNTPDNSLNSQSKDKGLNGIKPEFDFSSIGTEDFKAEAAQYMEQSNEAEPKKINPFPIAVFPQAVQEIIKATNESLQFPVDYIGTSILYAVSLAIGNTHRVEVKNGWQENSVLYIALVGRPNMNKSHPLTFAVQPIFDHDKKTFSEYERQKREYEQAEDKKDISKPVWQKFIVSDFTPEALAEVHRFNKRGIGVYVDELAGWFNNFNRYHKGSEQQFWLSAWNSKPITIDRKTGEPVFIPLPFISVVGTIQTGILNELAKNSRAQDGFIYRILFALPEGLQKPYWSETEIDTVIIDNWQTIISNLLTLELKLDDSLTPVPEILKFSPEALKELKQWQKQNTDLCNTVGNETLEGIYGKFELYVVRFALILEMLRYACGNSKKQSVGIEAVKGAIQLVEYFRATAVKVHSIISDFNPLDKLPTDKRQLYEALPDAFRTDEGLKVAALHDIPERTFKRFLNEKELFTRVKQGEYEKRIY